MPMVHGSPLDSVRSSSAPRNGAGFNVFRLVGAPGMLLAAASATAQATEDIVLVPRQVSAHGWFCQGAAGMASEQANRINAYGTYLLMEQEMLEAGKP